MPGLPGSFGGSKHERETIRDEIIAALTGKTDAGARLFRSRMPPVQGVTPSAPAISVYFEHEETDEWSSRTAARELRRTAVFSVVAFVATLDPETLDDALGNLALQIETAMDADDSLNGSVDYTYPGATVIDHDQGAKIPFGAVRIEYPCVYRSELRTAIQDDARDDFLSVDSKTSVDGVADPVEDTFNVRP